MSLSLVPPPLIALFRQPIVTGTSVLGIIYKDGVMLAADCLGTYLLFIVFSSDSSLFF